ncbi:transketolase [Roseivivax sp. GX 12232]|uniref:transketolase n=1 Tax=Roseivivax sp. GX 12232 TaxID=2900547 RepID=UPI001E327963|nr:transketolase [Roseivivax sp. GX 12232]MCE0506581.1 transketolase [Roseivivax sp. GX 12232]
MNNSPDFDAVREVAHRVRRHVLDMTSKGKSSHVGSALSMTDIVTVIYGHLMTYDPAYAKSPTRDRFILSKGHAGAAVYATLAEFGFFEPTRLTDHYQNGSVFSGHVSHKGVPGVELSTGSLGHGLGVAVGMAMAALRQKKTHRVYALLSDGECDEGSNWEAILFGAHHKLSNLTVAVDYNKIQSLAPVSETLALEPFADKWRAFGWHVEECDGHDHEALFAAFGNANAAPAPGVVICHTTKGKGVSFMEDSVLWHYRNAQGQEYEDAAAELEHLAAMDRKGQADA